MCARARARVHMIPASSACVPTWPFRPICSRMQLGEETRKRRRGSFVIPVVRITLAPLLPPTLENTCLRNQYRCSNGNCINSIWWCDFDNDCGDMSDERNCRESPGVGYQTCTIARGPGWSFRLVACGLGFWLATTVVFI